LYSYGVPYKDPEARRVNDRAYRLRNADQIRNYQREWMRQRKTDNPEVKRTEAERQKAWSKANPERRSEIVARNETKRGDLNRKSRRNSKLVRGYNITDAAYTQLLEKQNGGCAICGSRTVGMKTRTNLFVDHDHSTQRIRGLLCNDCNLGLGRFKDRPELLQRAAEYLVGVERGSD
jgi:hypothetical protein